MEDLTALAFLTASLSDLVTTLHDLQAILDQEVSFLLLFRCSCLFSSFLLFEIDFG